MYAQVDGKPSTLHKELLKKIPNRPLANLIYASYLQQGVADRMSTQGYKKNKQGQHNATDVMNYFKVAEIQNQVAKLSEIEQTIGAKDSNMDFINYTNAKEAIDKAVEANINNEGIVARVVRKGDVYNIIVEEKNSGTIDRRLEAQKHKTSWEILEHAFNGIGVDINTLGEHFSIFNALESKNIVDWLNNLRLTRNSLFSQKEIRTLLEINKDSALVQRLQNIFGDLDSVAEKIYDSMHQGVNNYTSAQKLLMQSVLDQSKKVKNLNLAALTDQINQNNQDISENSDEEKIKKTLEELDKEFGIDRAEIHSTTRKIRSLSDAAIESLATLKRELDALKRQHGINDEVKDLQSSINRLTREIENKKFYTGAIEFLARATQQFDEIDKLYKDALSATGTNLEKCKARAEVLMKIKNIRDGYAHIIEALSDLENLRTDTSISQEDLDTIQQQAKNLKKILDSYKNKIQDLEENTMIDIATEYIGNTLPNGQPTANIVKMAQLDGSYFDRYYSMGRVSNPLLATLGSVIRDAQSERNKKLNDISIRIKRATKKLHDSGSNTEFMYEKGTNYIISDIDWEAYHEARREAFKGFKAAGLKGIQLAEALQQWEEANTEDRVVDLRDEKDGGGRTERVPNEQYRKEFPKLTEAQREYYHTMMQIKAELGNLLPDYARKHYLPPQKRRSTIDALAKFHKTPIKAIKAILKNVRDKFVIREDDPLNYQNGVIDGEEYGIRDGALDNTPYRQIPIFFINRLKDQDELLKDFSGAMQALAGTAINYECMNEIQNMVEFMGNFMENQEAAAEENGVRQAEVIGRTKMFTYVKDLFKYAKNTNNMDLIRGYIDQYMYGKSLKSINRWTQTIQSIIGYTSSTLLSANVRGYFANVIASEYQMLLESGAGEFYNFKNYLKAHALFFAKGGFYALADSLTYNGNSFEGLIAQRFDPEQDKFREQSNRRYFRGKIRRLLSKDIAFLGYGAGEHIVRHMTMNAILYNTKVRVNGKMVSLRDALKKTAAIDGTSELQIVPGAEYKNENGEWVAVDEAYLDKIRDRVRYCGQTSFGSMNDEDKGIIHRTMFGRCLMQLKQWMVEHYSRRYRGQYWDATLKERREGFYYTGLRLFRGIINNFRTTELENALRFSDMNEMEKANFKRLVGEALITIALFLIPNDIFAPEDDDEEQERMMKYLALRGKQEIIHSTPIGLVLNGASLAKNPLPITTTLKNLTYPVTGLLDGHYKEEKKIQKGRYKDWNRYVRYMLKYTVPYYNQIDQYLHFADKEAEGMFKAFDFTSR